MDGLAPRFAQQTQTAQGATPVSRRRPQKRRAPWGFYLWPGLAHLWCAGSWAGLALAIGFTALLNVLIVSTAVWPEWLAPRVRVACGLVTLGLWLAAVWETRRELRRVAATRVATDPGAGAPDTASPDDHPRHDPALQELSRQERSQQENDELLRSAQACYLRGEWAQAEDAVRRLLRRDRDDTEGQLLLASVFRRSGRVEPARRRLEKLKLREDAERWRPEIDRELRLLARPAESDPESVPDGGPVQGARESGSRETRDQTRAA